MQSNKLINWIKNSSSNEKDVLNILQEWGIISDNCVDARDVGNDEYAMMWTAKNFERFKKLSV